MNYVILLSPSVREVIQVSCRQFDAHGKPLMTFGRLNMKTKRGKHNKCQYTDRIIMPLIPKKQMRIIVSNVSVMPSGVVIWHSFLIIFVSCI